MTQRTPADALTEIVAALGAGPGSRVLDIGCGHGRFARALSAKGVAVTGVDPDAAAVAAARAAAPDAEIVQAPAEELPFEDQSFDGVVFLNSLHHIEPEKITAALAEAARVLERGAPLVIVEPLAEGTFFEAMRPLEDETAVREQAQAAILAAASEGGALTIVETKEFDRVDAFPDAAAFIDRLLDADPTRRGALDAARGEVEARFETLGKRAGTVVTLIQPHRLHRLTHA